MEARALTPEIGDVPMLSFIGGLANMDITHEHISQVVDDIHQASSGRALEDVTWLQ
jgi:hypothetical protein